MENWKLCTPRGGLVLGAALLSACALPAWAEQTVKGVASYIDVGERRVILEQNRDNPVLSSAGQPGEALVWPDPVVKNLSMPSRYLSGNRINQQYQELRDVFDAFMRSLSHATDRVLISGDKDSAHEVLNQLYRWADQRSMETPTTGQGRYAQIFYGHTFAVALDILIQDGSLTADDNAKAEENKRKIEEIKSWLQAMMHENIRRINATNNIGDWQGLAVLLVGNLTDDEVLIERGLRKFRESTEKIAADNSLHHENARGELALWYNEYSLIPLILMAETIVRNPDLPYEGNPYFQENSRGQTLHDVVGLLLDARDTPALVGRLTTGDKHVQKMTGEEMDRGGTYISSWLELYNSRFPTPRFDDLMSADPDRLAQSPYHFGNRNMALAVGDLENERGQPSPRQDAPISEDHNYFGMTIKKGVAGKPDINSNFNFVDRSITDRGVAIAENGQDRSADRPTVEERGLDYLVIDKEFDPDEKLFSDDPLLVRQFIGIGFDNNVDNPTSTSGGRGRVWLRDGQTVRTWNTFLGYAYGTYGELTVSGPTALWDGAGDFKVGVSGEGRLTIENGGTVNSVDGYVGFGTPGKGDVLVTGEGSSWNNSRSLTIGNFGDGAVRVANGGRISASSEKWGIRIAPFPGSRGTLTIGGQVDEDGTVHAAEAPGIVETPRIQLGAATPEARERSFGEGQVALNFNHTSDDYLFEPSIIGTGQVNIVAGSTTFSGQNTYGGLTNILSGAALRAGGEGAFSANSSHRLAWEGLLDLNGFDQTIGALENNGVVRFGDDPGTVLNVVGDYAGGDGVLEMNARLDGDEAVGDQLVVGGSTSGNTIVEVNATGGEGAARPADLKLVAVSGQSDGNFVLQGDYLDNNEQALINGLFTYKLRQSQTGDWHLQSTLDGASNSAQTMASATGQSVTGAAYAPQYQPAVPAFEAYPRLLLGVVDNVGFQERVGQRMNAQLEQGLSAQKSSGPWISITADHNEYDRTGSVTGFQLDQSKMAVRIGGEGALSVGDDKILFGLNAHHTRSKGHIGYAHTVSQFNAEAYGIGAGLTWKGASGAYLDAQGQVSWIRSKLVSDHLGSLLEDHESMAYIASLEGGYVMSLADGVTLTPNVRISHKHVTFNDFSQAFNGRHIADVALGKGDTTDLLVGLRLERTIDWLDSGNTKSFARIYGAADLYYDLDNESSVTMAGVALRTSPDKLAAGFKLGASLSWRDDALSVFGDVSLRTSVIHPGQNFNAAGRVGLRVRW